MTTHTMHKEEKTEKSHLKEDNRPASLIEMNEAVDQLNESVDANQTPSDKLSKAVKRINEAFRGLNGLAKDLDN